VELRIQIDAAYPGVVILSGAKNLSDSLWAGGKILPPLGRQNDDTPPIIPVREKSHCHRNLFAFSFCDDRSSNFMSGDAFTCM
jgi:hypothetical protein